MKKQTIRLTIAKTTVDVELQPRNRFEGSPATFSLYECRNGIRRDNKIGELKVKELLPLISFLIDQLVPEEFPYWIKDGVRRQVDEAQQRRREIRRKRNGKRE